MDKQLKETIDLSQRLRKRVEIANSIHETYAYESCAYDGPDSCVPGYDAELDLRSANLIEELVSACLVMRKAQRAYMADRGNNEKGKEVGLAAQNMDEILERVDGLEYI